MQEELQRSVVSNTNIVTQATFDEQLRIMDIPTRFVNLRDWKAVYDKLRRALGDL